MNIRDYRSASDLIDTNNIINKEIEKYQKYIKDLREEKANLNYVFGWLWLAKKIKNKWELKRFTKDDLDYINSKMSF